MDYTPLLLVLFEQIVVPAAAALLGALGAWAATKLPGPLRDWLQSATHGRDMELLVGALGRGALSVAREVLAGRATAADAADRVAGYARENLPAVVAKLRPSDEALRTMAAAAVERALKDVLG